MAGDFSQEAVHAGARSAAATGGRGLAWRWPLPVGADALLAAAVGVGHLNLLADTDGVSRSEPLIADAQGVATCLSAWSDTPLADTSAT